MWTESLAVGAESLAQHIGRRIPNRMQVRVEPAPGREGLWVARKPPVEYGTKSGPQDRAIQPETSTSQT